MDSTKVIKQDAKITGTRTVKADLHNHLRTSSRMEGLFNPAIDRAQKMLGPGGLFALVNFEDHRYEDFASEKGYERQDLKCALYVPEKDILVVKGQEVPTKDGHLLVLGLRKGVHLTPHRGLASTMLEAKGHGGIVIADHPFYVEGIGPYIAKNMNILSSIDAIEGHNGCASLAIPFITPEEANKEAQRVYNFVHHHCPNLGFISTSDGHSLYELGRSYTHIKMPHYSKLAISKDVRENLGEAVRESRIENCIMKPSKFGTAMHLFDIAALAALRKLGFQNH